MSDTQEKVDRCPHCGACLHCGAPKQPEPPAVVPTIIPYPYPVVPQSPWITWSGIDFGSSSYTTPATAWEA